MDSIGAESFYAGREVLTRPAWPIVFLLAVAGGLAGILAAIFQELSQGHQLFTAFLIGPAIEEASKPIGVLLILAFRPHWFRSRFEVIFYSLMGAAIFATLENLMYIHLTFADHGTDFVIFRYTVCTALHLTATFIFALGLSRLWTDIRVEGVGFDIDRCMWYYVVAFGLHAVYNTTVMILSATDVLSFE
jgi:RsiW-degrading membrane proteinase PrsW (M82 family)